MTDNGNTSFSWAEERRFGRGVGGVLSGLGALIAYTGRNTALGIALIAAGATLVVLSVVAPRFLTRINRGWMTVALALSYVSTRIILGIVFFAGLVPTALIHRLGGGDALGRRAARASSYWRPYSGRVQQRNHYDNMY